MSRPTQPHIVFWEITERCNFACEHCRRAQVEAEEMSAEQSMQILNHLAPWKGLRLIFTGGEPTLRGDLPCLAAKANEIGLIPLLATNATHMTEALAGDLHMAGIRRASVSLLGDSAENNDLLAGLTGSFERALSGIDTLQTAGIEVQINYVITTASAARLPETASLAKKLGAVALHLFLFVPTGRGCDIPDAGSFSPKEMEEIFEETTRIIQSSNLPIRFTCCPQYLAYLAKRGIPPRGHIAGCGAGKSVLFVATTGKVYPCGYFPLEVGDLLKQTGPEIWEGSERLLKLADAGELKEACGTCAHRFLCGGCRARAYATKGDAFALDPSCPWEK